MILVIHNIVKCKDDNYPTSLSKSWHDILRYELNFSGLILTDDLFMNAIKKYIEDLSLIFLSINAGKDVLLTRDYYEHLEAAFDVLIIKLFLLKLLIQLVKELFFGN